MDEGYLTKSKENKVLEYYHKRCCFCFNENDLNVLSSKPFQYSELKDCTVLCDRCMTFKNKFASFIVKKQKLNTIDLELMKIDFCP